MEATDFAKPGANISSGMSNTFYLIDFDDLETIATVYASPATTEQEVMIDGSHVPKAGEGFVPFWTDPQATENQLTHAMNGEGVSANTMKELTVFYPGKSKKVAAFLKRKPQVIALVPDINCSDNEYIQIGSKCQPAFIKEWSHAVGNVNNAEKKGYTIVLGAYADSILFYNGDLTLKS
jgi:hypothetical protein